MVFHILNKELSLKRARKAWTSLDCHKHTHHVWWTAKLAVAQRGQGHDLVTLHHALAHYEGMPASRKQT